MGRRYCIAEMDFLSVASGSVWLVNCTRMQLIFLSNINIAVLSRRLLVSCYAGDGTWCIKRCMLDSAGQSQRQRRDGSVEHGRERRRIARGRAGASAGAAQYAARWRRRVFASVLFQSENGVALPAEWERQPCTRNSAGPQKQPPQCQSFRFRILQGMLIPHPKSIIDYWWLSGPGFII